MKFDFDIELSEKLFMSNFRGKSGFLTVEMQLQILTNIISEYLCFHALTSQLIVMKLCTYIVRSTYRERHSVPFIPKKSAGLILWVKTSMICYQFHI